MIVDYLRSCYNSTMIFRVGDDPVPVKWLFADSQAGIFPGWNIFVSRNWDSRVFETGQLGEQAITRKWTPGTPKPPGRGCFPCPTVQTWFESGIPIGELTPPVGIDGIPLCCSKPCPCYCDGLAIPDVLTATIVAPSCSGIDGITVTLNRQQLRCQWNGSFTIPFSTTTISLRMTGVAKSPEGFRMYARYDSPPFSTADRVASSSSSTCDPLALVFSGVDWSSVLPCPPFDINVSP